MTPTEWIQPNSFDLRGEGVELSLATDIAGGWHLTYNGETWPGPNGGIDDQPGPFGRLITATLEVIPDGGTRTLTLVVPTVHLPADQAGAASDVSALAIRAFHRSSLIGPAGVEGQVEEYEAAVALTGTASFNPS